MGDRYAQLKDHAWRELAELDGGRLYLSGPRHTGPPARTCPRAPLRCLLASGSQRATAANPRNAAGGSHASSWTLRKARTALWPPNPKLLLRATSMESSRAWLGMQSRSHCGSAVS